MKQPTLPHEVLVKMRRELRVTTAEITSRYGVEYGKYKNGDYVVLSKQSRCSTVSKYFHPGQTLKIDGGPWANELGFIQYSATNGRYFKHGPQIFLDILEIELKPSIAELYMPNTFDFIKKVKSYMKTYPKIK